jgi:GxxExxY protein
MTQIKADQIHMPAKNVEVTERIIGIFYEVYNELGYGFLESVYREAMRVALVQAGLQVATEVPVPVHFRGNVIGIFRADLIVNQSVLVELKTCDGLASQHDSQTLHYLRATEIETALLMNFGTQPKFKRLTMDNERKKSVSSISICVKPFAEGGTK